MEGGSTIFGRFPLPPIPEEHSCPLSFSTRARVCGDDRVFATRSRSRRRGGARPLLFTAADCVKSYRRSDSRYVIGRTMRNSRSDVFRSRLFTTCGFRSPRLASSSPPPTTSFSAARIRRSLLPRADIYAAERSTQVLRSDVDTTYTGSRPLESKK